MTSTDLQPTATASRGLNVAEVEQLYDELALAVDAAGPELSERMLAKLALLLANALGDATQVSALIRAAKEDL